MNIQDYQQKIHQKIWSRWNHYLKYSLLSYFALSRYDSPSSFFLSSFFLSSFFSITVEERERRRRRIDLNNLFIEFNVNQINLQSHERVIRINLLSFFFSLSLSLPLPFFWSDLTLWPILITNSLTLLSLFLSSDFSLSLRLVSSITPLLKKYSRRTKFTFIEFFLSFLYQNSFSFREGERRNHWERKLRERERKWTLPPFHTSLLKSFEYRMKSKQL